MEEAKVYLTAFLEELATLMEKYDANFQVEVSSVGYSGYSIDSVDVEVRQKNGSLWDYTEIEGGYFEAEDIREILDKRREE